MKKTQGVLSYIFIILGAVVLGRKFTLKAALGSFVYIVGLDIFEEIPFEINTEHFLAVAFGGAILGAGFALILRNGSFGTVSTIDEILR